MEFNSTYGLKQDNSFRDEGFYSISSSWGSGSRPILKIRLARWKPKSSRENCAILYYDVQTKDEAIKIASQRRQGRPIETNSERQAKIQDRIDRHKEDIEAKRNENPDKYKTFTDEEMLKINLLISK